MTCKEFEILKNYLPKAKALVFDCDGTLCKWALDRSYNADY